MMTNGTQRRRGREAWAAAALAFGCVFSPVARAQDTGFEAGLRVEYGIPLGDATGAGRPLSDGISGQIPLAIDLGYRVIPNLFIGLYAQYGFGFVGDEISN